MDFYLSVVGYLHGQDDVGDLYLNLKRRHCVNYIMLLKKELLAIEQRRKRMRRHHLTKNVLLFMTNFEASSEKTP